MILAGLIRLAFSGYVKFVMDAKLKGMVVVDDGECVGCGAAILDGRRKYCSAKCKYRRNCQSCGVAFDGSAQQKFCSPACYQRCPRIVLQCCRCGVEFVRHEGRRVLFCGRVCSDWQKQNHKWQTQLVEQESAKLRANKRAAFKPFLLERQKEKLRIYARKKYKIKTGETRTCRCGNIFFIRENGFNAFCTNECRLDRKREVKRAQKKKAKKRKQKEKHQMKVQAILRCKPTKAILIERIAENDRKAIAD